MVMVRLIVPALLIVATFTSAIFFVAIIIGCVLAVLFILTLKEAAKKSCRRLPYGDALDSQYRDASICVLWLSLPMHGGRGTRMMGTAPVQTPGSAVILAVAET